MRSKSNFTTVILLGLWVAACSPLIDASEINCKPNDAKCEEGFPPNPHWAPYHPLNNHQIVKDAMITLVADDMGNPWTNNGERVYFLGDGNELIAILRLEGRVYLVTK